MSNAPDTFTTSSPVECPVCHAPPSQPCTGSRGKPLTRTLHAQRIRSERPHR